MLVKALLSTLAITLTTIEVLKSAIAIPQSNSFTIAAIENVEGWRDTSWGMSYDEVKKRYPFTDEARDNSGKTDPNRYVGLRKITINNCIFNVRFVFEEGHGLDAVALWWQRTSPESSNPTYSIIDNLKTKYGSPDEESSGYFPDTNFKWSKKMKWVKPTTVIALDATDNYVSLIYDRYKANEGF